MPLPTIADLTRDADLIVRGRVQKVEAVLSKDEASVRTYAQA